MTCILLAPTKELAQAVIADLTVECEYGSTVLEGSLYTAAHHQESGPYAGRHIVPGGKPSPCNDPDIPNMREGSIILVSHLDLDTIGGVLRGIATWFNLLFAYHPKFWELAEFVDVNGPHRMDENHRYAPYIRACWAWIKENRPPPAWGKITNVTSFIKEAEVMLEKLLEDHSSELLEMGEEFRRAENALNKDSLVEIFCVPNGEFIAMRKSDGFVNHLYKTYGEESKEDLICEAVVAFNTKFNSITVSFESSALGINAKDFVQSLWGPDAGGHPNIAGSPRGKQMTESDLSECCRRLMIEIDSSTKSYLASY